MHTWFPEEGMVGSLGEKKKQERSELDTQLKPQNELRFLLLVCRILLKFLLQRTGALSLREAQIVTAAALTMPPGPG